ncbi:MAG: hypothetical protein ACE5QV_03510, partial [Fidelibacterota bacterium]
RLINNFPMAGDVAILISDDSTNFADADILLSAVFPRPDEYNSDGSVKVPGDSVVQTILDSAKINIFAEDKDHYIKPRVHLMGTENATPDSVITIKSTDFIGLQANVIFVVKIRP